jgi:hypothetical protein
LQEESRLLLWIREFPYITGSADHYEEMTKMWVDLVPQLPMATSCDYHPRSFAIV